MTTVTEQARVILNGKSDHDLEIIVEKHPKSIAAEIARELIKERHELQKKKQSEESATEGLRVLLPQVGEGAAQLQTE